MDRHDTLLLSCKTRENRHMLRDILCERFHLLEASNLHQTNMLLEQNIGCIAAVILDTTDRAEEEDVLAGDHSLFQKQIPVIVLISEDDPEILRQAFDLGASDVIPLHYEQDAMLRRIETIVELSVHKRHLETLVEEQAKTLRRSNDAMMDVLSSIIEYRSVESGQHILRIRQFTKILLEELKQFCPEYGLTDREIGIISSASALHDVGKISIPDAILNKPEKLTPEEMTVMQSHTLTGCHILKRLAGIGNEEFMRYAYNICRYHHERWDGKGYPQGLSGDAIPICAQVVALADVYDALTTRRVYKEAYSFDTAVNMILKGECGVFSPKLLECFKHITGQYEALARAYADGLDPGTEAFDVSLPLPEETEAKDSIAYTWGKYQALVHYSNVFLLELDMDQGLFHLIYNPYPEIVSFHNITTFPKLAQLILDRLVVPEQRERMKKLIFRDVDAFLDAGLRRVNHRFCFRSNRMPQGEPFDVTLLRINPNDSQRRKLSVLCKRVKEQTVAQQELSLLESLSADTFCSRYDENFTLLPGEYDARKLAGYSQQEILTQFGGRLIELVVPEDRDQLRQTFREQLGRGTAVQAEYRLRSREGQILWVLNKSRLALGADGNEYLYSTLTDITSTKQALEKLSQKLSRYEIVLAQTENVLFDWDVQDDRIVFSDTWERIFDAMPVAEKVHHALLSGSYFHPDDLPLLFDRISNLENGSNYEMTELRVASGGRYIWCRIRASAIRDPGGRLARIVGIIINIDVEKQAAHILQLQAERDSLTKLLNKDAARKQAEEYFRKFEKNLNCALLIIDLDDFKQVNDQHGHLFGDAVLTRAAREMQKLFRSQDIIARIGGDEFMVLMRGISDRELVANRCKRLTTSFQNAFRNQHYQLPLSCSIGIALAPAHAASYVELFQCADQALYQAKDRGKNDYVFYQPGKPVYSRRGSMVSNRIDSDEQPGLADSNIVRYAFQRLYSSQDVGAAMNDILDLIGRQLNVSRVYIFENSPDNRFCSNTYEWCNEGILPEKENLQNISYETDIPHYEQNFDEQGIFYCPDVTQLPKHIYDIVAPQGIKSMLHCAIRDKGVFRGYIGFDECTKLRFWTKEQIQVLTYFSEMLSVFLLKKQAQDRTAQKLTELSSILDNQNAWIYIIDPDTCELKYLNAKTRELAPFVETGMLCYQALLGCDERCADCPARNIRQDRTGSTVLHNRRFDMDILAEATLIQWEGTESCLLTCRQWNGGKSALQNEPSVFTNKEKM